jgi:hypothetical protein
MEVLFHSCDETKHYGNGIQKKLDKTESLCYSMR